MNTNNQSYDLNQIGEHLNFLMYAYNKHTIKCSKAGETDTKYEISCKCSAITNKTAKEAENFQKTRDILQLLLDDQEMQIAINLFEALLTQEKRGIKFNKYAGYQAIHSFTTPTLFLRFGNDLMTVELPPLHKHLKAA
jgi:hypothetical protein